MLNQLLCISGRALPPYGRPGAAGAGGQSYPHPDVHLLQRHAPQAASRAAAGTALTLFNSL
jgi:hypothetical protein